MERVLEPEVMDTAEEADGYDSMDHSEPNAAFVARLVELGARGRMLDIGTGPGHIPLLVCEKIPDAHVVGIDLALYMLAHAERHRRASPYAARIEYRLADAKGLDFPDGSFDTVFSNTILHHIPDPRPFLAEAWRVLKPGGALLIRDLYRPATPERALELVALHAAGATPYQRELFHASLKAALTPTELRAVARAAGLVGAEIVIDTDRHMSIQISATRAKL
ncbi:MAG: methyltransferase domain-containing protein [Planctomycetota bacterium]